MSALLPLSERVYELNLCAEHGYTYRRFNRTVRVFQSTDYKSALFLVYATYEHTLPHRKTPHRNHFTLYRNADTVVVVRSETTLKFQDHDAALQYDVITPTEAYRATTECGWTVSFDKIVYSNARPSFIGYTLVCSGEWWYFENGVILNGVTAYEKDITCGNMFVYYELHPKYNIVSPLVQDYRAHARTRLLTAATASSSLPSFLVGRTGDSANGGHHGRRDPNPSAGNDSVADTRGGRVDATATNITATATNTTVTTTTTTTTTQNTATATTPSSCNPRTQLCSFLIDQSRDATDTSAGSAFHVAQAATLNANIAPIANALARPIIQSNDAQEVPDPDTKTVVPSTFWFAQRSKELDARCISYFLPNEFRPTTPDLGGGRTSGFLDDAYYNTSLPAVPLPQLYAMTDSGVES